MTLFLLYSGPRSRRSPASSEHETRIPKDAEKLAAEDKTVPRHYVRKTGPSEAGNFFKQSFFVFVSVVKLLLWN